MAKLGEVCIQITDGSHNPPSGVEQSEYLMLSSKNIDDDFITLDSPRFLSHSDYIAENKRTTVSEGDLLMTIVGTIGRVAIVPAGLNGICLQRSVAVIKPNKEIINNRYLMYQLQNMRSFLEKEARGVAQKGIYLKQVSQLDIKLPELEQQKQIVKVLDKVTELISLRKQQLTKLDELVKARFVEMFGEPIGNPMGWKRVRFDSISENLDSKRVPVTESDRKDGVYPYYGASGIVDWINDYIFDEDILLVSEDGANLLMRSTPIAFSVSGKSWVNNHAHVVRFHDFATQKFIEVYFSLIDISEYITGTAQPKLNQAKLNTMLFCWPPLSLQKQFAAFVERVDQQKQTVQQSFEKLELMKKALMQEYFG